MFVSVVVSFDRDRRFPSQSQTKPKFFVTNVTLYVEQQTSKLKGQNDGNIGVLVVL